MPILFLLLFIGLPILEIAVFIQAGDVIGLGWTLAIVIATGIAGTALLRTQGYGVIGRIRQRMEAGEPPLFEMFEGLCIFAAGLLLLTPGFVTDTMGFLLFLPPVRRVIAAFVAARIAVQVVNAARGMDGEAYSNGPYSNGPYPNGPRPNGPHWNGGFPGGRGRRDGDGPIIDGDYQAIDPDAGQIEPSDKGGDSRNR